MEINPTVFITGATGLLGINTVEVLLAKDYRVIALTRDAEKAKRVLPQHPNLEILVGDLEKADLWLPVVSKVDYVIHAAAYFREYFGRGDHSEKLKQLNVELPLKLVQKSLECGVRRIVVVSSSGAISRPTDGKPCNESAMANGQVPSNGYQQSKVQMEKELSKLGIPSEQLVIVRPGWMFGPNDYAPTGAGQIILDFQKVKTFQFVDGPPFGIVDARDVANGIGKILECAKPSGIYHLAGNNLGPLDAIKTLAAVEGKTRVKGVPLRMVYVLSRVFELVTRLFGKRNPMPFEGIEVLATNFAIDSSRAERELGVTFRAFAETAKDAISFMNHTFKR